MWNIPEVFSSCYLVHLPYSFFSSLTWMKKFTNFALKSLMLSHLAQPVFVPQ